MARERYIHEKGWPAATPENEAVPATLEDCRITCEEQGWSVLGEPAPLVTLVQTPEHEAAGEYIVSLTVWREKEV